MTDPQPRVWTGDPTDPDEPWVWPPDDTHPATTDPDTLRITTNQAAGRHYTLEPVIESPGFWTPVNSDNPHEFVTFWLEARWVPLTEVLPG